MKMYILLISALLLLSACSKTQLANPASQFCQDHGGTLEMINAADGSQSGVCTLKDGTKCDEWAYMRGECSGQAHICTKEEQDREACTKEYSPVCGSDKKTYPNGCDACTGGVESWTAGACVEFDIVEPTESRCSADADCTTPDRYLLRSDCPYTSKCIEGKCTVVCPMKEGNAPGCGECPQYMPPAPDFCKDGTVLVSEKDECGCQLPPKCVAPQQGACPEDAKVCPDGTTVVRDPVFGCEFAPCPGTESNSGTQCTDPRPEACTLEYMPVCGWFGQDIKCIKYPCANTYGNKCAACADPQVAYWTEGGCPIEDISSPMPQGQG